MKRLTPILFLLVLGATSPLAGQAYSFKDIPAHLLDQANSVIRKDERTFSVFSKSSAREDRLLAITVLNKSGLDEASLYLPLNEFRKPQFKKGVVYDQFGQKISQFGPKSLEKLNPYSSMSLYDSNKLLQFEPESGNFPYTIEYEFSIDYEGLMWFPQWHPQIAKSSSLEYGRFEVRLPEGENLRFKALNGAGLPERGNDNSWIWEFQHLPALKNEIYSPPLEDLSPTVLLAPGDFSFGGLEGSFDSWKNYGIWYQDLNKETDNLDPETKIEVKRLVSALENDVERSKAIYEFMQSRTRYVGIQLGIGGWKSFPAHTTHEKGYGDCKALTYYMHSLLNAVGIESFPVLIRAGIQKSEFHSDFPSNQFNHLILCVPGKGDTTWLECTSQNNPFDYIGSFTQGRPCLVIGKNGGILGKTPELGPSQNLQARTVNLSLQANGRGKANLRGHFGGIFYEKYAAFPNLGEENRRQKLYQTLEIPEFTIEDDHWEQRKGREPAIACDLQLQLPRFASTTSKRLIFSPFQFSEKPNIPPKDENRKHGFLISYSRTEADTIQTFLPGNFQPEFIPPSVDSISEFGRISISHQVDGNNMTSIRLVERIEQEVPPQKYDGYRNWMEFISHQTQATAVFKQTE